MSSSAYQQEWRRKNRERWLATQREWYRKNRERHLACGREAYRKNRERRLAAAKAWYQANRARALASVAAFAVRHPDRVRHYKRKWERENGAYKTAYALAHRDEKHLYDVKRGIKRRFGDVDPELLEMLLLMREFYRRTKEHRRPQARLPAGE